ncbi:MAG TPA: extracellular solute-binding protein [Terriglobales bacterium]|jgi:ABC-type glycerol-3-phosphate transport system substrate-binding protein|nr:extracellular solute-binding protein [Terriglobales bacterium]
MHNRFQIRSATRVAFCLALLLIALPPNVAAQTAPITIRLAGDEWFLHALTGTGLIDSYERESGVRVQVIFKNDRAILGELDKASDENKKGDDAPFDLIVVRHRFLGALVEKHEVQPIDSFLADRSLHDPAFRPEQQLYANWWKELSSYKGQIYGYPFTALTAYLCYRKDLLADPANRRDFLAQFHRQLRPPRNWKEYSELAQFFNRPDQHFYGTYIQGKQSLALWYEWLNFIYAFGGNVLDAKHGWQYGDIVVNSPQNLSATQQYLKLIAFSPPDTLTYGWNEAQSALQQGHVFMGILWSDQAPFLEDPKVSRVAGKIGYALIPSNSAQQFSQLEGLTYLITAKSQHAREAYKFLEWTQSQRVQVAQTLRGSSSIRKATYHDPDVAKLPYTAAFLASLPIAKPKATVPESDAMTQAAVRHLSEIVSGKTSAQQGLDALAVEMQRILNGKARLHYPVKQLAKLFVNVERTSTSAHFIPFRFL